MFFTSYKPMLDLLCNDSGLLFTCKLLIQQLSAFNLQCTSRLLPEVIMVNMLLMYHEV